MFNLKISLVLLTAVALITAGSLVVTNEYFVGILEQDSVGDLTVAREGVLRAGALDAHGHEALASQVAAWPMLGEKLLTTYAEGIEGLDERHQQVWEELNVWHAKLVAAREADKGKESPAHALEDRRQIVPDEMYVVDAAGTVVARFTDYAAWGNSVAAELPQVLEVGRTRQPDHTSWRPANSGPLEVAIAPIFGSPPEEPPAPPAALPAGEPAVQPAAPAEVFAGAVILGFRRSDAEAIRLQKRFGAEVIFYYGKEAASGSLPLEIIEQAQKQILEQTEASTTGRVSVDTVYLLRDRKFRASGSLLPASTGGFLVLVDQGKRLQPIHELNVYIPLAGAGVFLFLLIVSAVIVRHFIRSLELLDQGIHEVINGNFEYNFPSSRRDSLVGNLGNSLNLMICTLLGKPLPEDEDSTQEECESRARGDGSWKDPLFIDEVSQVRKRPDLVGLPLGAGGMRRPSGGLAEADSNNLGSSGDVRVERIEAGALTQELAIETEESYFRRLFDEYLAARQETGEGVQGVTLDKFVAKLRSTEAGIKEQLGCRMVRFRIQKKDGRVTLKPIPME